MPGLDKYQPAESSKEKNHYRKSYFDNRVRRNEVCLSDDQLFAAPDKARDLV